jgi:hypothetical protein
MKKDWKDLRKQAEQQGWRIERTCSDHFKWYSPNGNDIVVSGLSCSDHRAMKNHIAMMRRAGFQI